MVIGITGFAGHIGTNITIEAIKRGHKVVGMDNLHREEVINNLRYLQKEYNKDQFEFVWGDVRNADDFDRMPKVDAVIHLAANPGIPWSIKWPVYDFETNAKGTIHALEFARKCGNVPFVYASTNKTFSDIINKLPVEETDTRYVWSPTVILNEDPMLAGIDFENGKPVAINQNFPTSGFGKFGHSMYGISKLTGDNYVQEYHCQYGLPTAINKMSCIYGLFQKGVEDQGWISHFLLKIGWGDGNLNFYGTGKQVRDLLDARDVARLYIDEVEDLASENSKCDGEIFTIGGGSEQTLSLIETIEKLEAVTGKKANITFYPKRPADQDIYISSLKRVTEVLGWKPEISIDQTIKDMFDEYSK